jgi:uncharacterized membrane protein YbhN (UPF0104 family)
MRKIFYSLIGFFIICLGMIYFILINEYKISNILSKIFLPIPVKVFIIEFINKFTSGLLILKTPMVLSKSFIVSVVLWIFEILFLIIVACSCNVQLSIVSAIFTVIIIGIGSIIPTAPGYFGAFEFMGILALSVVSVNRDVAFICISIYHFLQLMVIFILGFICIIKTKLSFSDLFKFGKIEKSK